MAVRVIKVAENQEISVEEKLYALYCLQSVDSEVDKIRILRGELPLEVQDLEDEITGLQTRIKNFEVEIKDLQTSITGKKSDIKNSLSLIKKYETQQQKVRNNREFDSLAKEIEYQNLDIQLSEKRIAEFNEQLTQKKSQIEKSRALLEERSTDLMHKKAELDKIINENKERENELHNQSEELAKLIETRLITAYRRIRGNARNGLAVVHVERDACGGCYNKIPPQRQLDIRTRRKIIVCEYCGRILVDPEIGDLKNEENNEKTPF